MKDEEPIRIFKTEVKHRPFSAVDNATLKDPYISFKAKGLLSYLIGKPQRWVVNIKAITSDTREQTNSIRAGLLELGLYGYLTKVRVPGGNSETLLVPVPVLMPDPGAVQILDEDSKCKKIRYNVVKSLFEKDLPKLERRVSRQRVEHPALWRHVSTRAHPVILDVILGRCGNLINSVEIDDAETSSRVDAETSSRGCAGNRINIKKEGKRKKETSKKERQACRQTAVQAPPSPVAAPHSLLLFSSFRKDWEGEQSSCVALGNSGSAGCEWDNEKVYKYQFKAEALATQQKRIFKVLQSYLYSDDCVLELNKPKHRKAVRLMFLIMIGWQILCKRHGRDPTSISVRDVGKVLTASENFYTDSRGDCYKHGAMKMIVSDAWKLSKKDLPDTWQCFNRTQFLGTFCDAFDKVIAELDKN